MVTGRRELRIAPVMTGGTSLAVWMGGVTAELYRVVNCRDDDPGEHDPYRQLLDLTATDALVDVVTGTSAGGLNGVLLSAAWSMRVPTADVVGLRDLWMRLGSLPALLRSPNERHPPSLLKGDEYFWPQLTKVLKSLAHAKRSDDTTPGRGRRETDLAVTVTTLEGDPTSRFDDFERRLNETRQAHRLLFDERDFADPTDKRWAERVALAARTSASIPGVFEPSYLPIGESTSGRPAFRADRATFGVSRWAVDGGVTVNLPLGEALERIYRKPAQTEVRRVALFVNPTPAGLPERVVADPLDDLPTLVEVVGASVNAPRNESIAADVDDMRARNRRVERSVDARQALAQLVAIGSSSSSRLSLRQMAEGMFGRFREVRASGSVLHTLDRARETVRLDQTFVDLRAIEGVLREATDVWIPRQLDPVTPPWPWGISPVEYLAGVLLDLIGRTLRLPLFATEREWAALVTAKEAAFVQLGVLDDLRRTDDSYWAHRLSLLDGATPNLVKWAYESYEQWPFTPGGAYPDPATAQQSAKQRLWDSAVALATVAVDVMPAIARVLDELDQEGRLAPEVDEDRRQLRATLALLTPAAGTSPAAVLDEVLALHVVLTALGQAESRQQIVELMEVSWNAENLVDPARQPDDKLAGPEFGRLGAFLKPSWRANDWMWGRLDGAYQLVLLLLDPARLRQLDLDSDDVRALPGLERVGGVDGPPDDIDEELLYLEQETLLTPRTLPLCAARVAERVQLDIARRELPLVAAAVRATTDAPPDGGRFVDECDRRTAGGRTLNDDDVRELLRLCRVGEENATTEVGSDSLTRTAGAAAVVAANLVTGDHAGVGWPGRIARPLRQAGLAIYAVTHSTTTMTRTGIAASALIFAVAGAIVAMRLFDFEVASGFVFLAAVVLLVGVGLAILRSGLWSQWPVLLALLVVALALIGDSMSEIITSEPATEPSEVALTGDELTATGDLRLRIIDGDGAERTETFSGSASVLIEDGSASVSEEVPDPAWKNTLFLNRFSVAAVLIWIGVAFWLVSWSRRTAVALAARRRRVGPGEANRRFPIRLVVELIAMVLIVAFYPAVFDRLLHGSADDAWRRWVIDRSSELGALDLIVVLGGLVLIGVLLAVGWDRTVRRLLPRR